MKLISSSVMLSLNRICHFHWVSFPTALEQELKICEPIVCGNPREILPVVFRSMAVRSCQGHVGGSVS